MLEYSGLLITPDQTQPSPKKLQWRITCLREDELLGTVTSTAVVSGWRSWLGPLILEARESDDEPLLMTVHRNWIRHSRWQVFDADSRHVGRLAGSQIFDARERNLANLYWDAEQREGSFETFSGKVFASLHQQQNSWRFCFAEDQPFHPFRRMLLLASTFRWILGFH